MFNDAVLDESKKYRYLLERRWGPDTENIVNFVLLNPSTADATNDDPTIRACIAFAKAWKFDGLIVTNLFAFRATDPAEMKKYKDPVGVENEAYLTRAAMKAKKVVAAWGAYGDHLNRSAEVIGLLRDIQSLYCFGTTKNRNPKHPLYVARATPLIEFVS